MLSTRLLAEDIRTLCKLIDDLSLLPTADAGQNTVIYESCAYMLKVFLPTLLDHYLPFFQNQGLQKALLDFLDIVSIRYEKEDESKLQIIRNED